MYTQCPDCLAIYRVDAAILAEGLGRGQCGRCHAVFDLLQSISDDLPLDAQISLKLHIDTGVIPLLNIAVVMPAREQGELFSEGSAKYAQEHSDTPHFIHSEVSTVSIKTHNWGWIVSCVFLCGLLIMQSMWINRALLLQHDIFRNIWFSICSTCELPVAEDRSRMALLERDVRPHPEIDHALLISLTFTNRALFTQTFPILEVVLSDVNGERIAMRRFWPHEYLHDMELLNRGLPAGAISIASLEVEDPGHQAVAFEFHFL